MSIQDSTGERPLGINPRPAKPARHLIPDRRLVQDEETLLDLDRPLVGLAAFGDGLAPLMSNGVVMICIGHSLSR